MKTVLKFEYRINLHTKLTWFNSMLSDAIYFYINGFTFQHVILLKKKNKKIMRKSDLNQTLYSYLYIDQV